MRVAPGVRGRGIPRLGCPEKEKAPVVAGAFEACPCEALGPRSRSTAARSAIISVGALVLPLVMVGITLASAMRRPGHAAHAQLASTTAIGSSAGPSSQVPTGWKMVVPMSPASRASSSSVWNCTPGFTSRGLVLRQRRLRDDAPRQPQRLGGDLAVFVGDR
jgi:hypothetical protein